MRQLATAGDLPDAIELAETAFPSDSEAPADYRLVRAELLLGGHPDCSGVRCWRLTFKHVDLIPADADSRLGAGGELFVRVDLDAGKATLVGQGE